MQLNSIAVFIITCFFALNVVAKQNYEITYGNKDIYQDESNVIGDRKYKQGGAVESIKSLQSKELYEGDDNSGGVQTNNSPNTLPNFPFNGNVSQQILSNNQVTQPLQSQQGSGSQSNSPFPANPKFPGLPDVASIVTDNKKDEKSQDKQGNQLPFHNGNIYDHVVKADPVKVAKEPQKQPITPLKIMNAQDESDLRAQNELQRRISISKGVKLSDEQIEAFGLPLPSQNRVFDTKIQRLPPNVFQRLYNKSNNHLTRVVVPEDYVINAFKMISEQDTNVMDFSALVEVLQNRSAVDKYGNTLLMHAINMKKHNVVIYLINHGIRMNQRNKFGITPLHLAAYIGDHISSVALIEAGADVNLADDNGNTPLMYAVLSADPSLVKRFIDFNADMGSKNKKGLEVMDFAYHTENLAMVNFLLQKGHTLLVHKDVLSKQSFSEEYVQLGRGKELIDQYRNILDRSEYFYYAH